MLRVYRAGLGIVWMAGGLLAVSAQWTTQTLNLRAGWNAVFLEVQPEPADCDGVFGNLPVESVWRWNQRFTTVQYISDPNALLPGQPDWLMHVPLASPDRAVANLFVLEGGRSYLIKATANATLSLRGRPVRRELEWLSGSFNLAGFHVSSVQPPSFQTLLEPSAVHVGQPIYRLSAAGTWDRVTSASTTLVNRGECYWIRSGGVSGYSGPFEVIFEQGRGMDYGRTVVEQALRIQNTSAGVKTYTLALLASEAPPGPAYPALAGPVPLSVYRSDVVNREFGWVPVTGALVSPAIAPGGEWSMRLAVRRADMVAVGSLPAGYTEASYQSLLDLSDGAGARQLIAVTAEGPATIALSQQNVVRTSRGGIGLLNHTGPDDPRAGLWVGSAVITNVSQAAVSSVPVPTAGDFQFRLILHVDGAGETRLLQQVVLAWTNGVYAINEEGIREVVTPGRFALITDDGLLRNFAGSAVRDGAATGQRISSAAFAFREPIVVERTARFGEPGGELSCVVPLDGDDPLNPFKHRYHPGHDNLDSRYESPRQESLEVTRQVTFEFTLEDPDDTTLPGWGDNQLGGIYRETLIGLHKAPIYVQGNFRLQRISTVPVLNDQPH